MRARSSCIPFVSALALFVVACNGGDDGSPTPSGGPSGTSGGAGVTGSAGTSAAGASGGTSAGGSSIGGTNAGGSGVGGAGGTSAGGAGQSFSILLNVVDFQADDQSLYLLDRGLGESDGKVARRPVATTASTDELSSTEGEPRVLRMNASSIVWLARSASSTYADSNKKWAVRSLPKNAAPGASPTTVIDGIGGGNSPGEIAVDDAYVYWVELSSFALWRAPIGGGAKDAWFGMGTNEVSYDTRKIRVDDTSVYYTDGSGSQGAVEVWAVDKDGTHHRQLATNVNVVRELFLDATSVYWVDSNDGDASYGTHLFKAPKDGSAPATEVGTLMGHVGATGVVTGQTVWVGTHDGAASTTGDVLVSFPASGGAASIALGALKSPPALRANTTTLFVPSQGAGTTFFVMPI